MKRSGATDIANIPRYRSFLSNHSHLLLLTILLSLVLGLAPRSTAQPADSVAGLFVELPFAASASADRLQLPQDPIQTRRSRALGISRDAVRKMLERARSERSTLVAIEPDVHLNLFADTSLPFYVESTKETPDKKGLVLIGTVGFDREGTAILSLYEGAVSGSIRLRSGEFYELFVPTSGVGEVKQQEFRGGYGGAADWVLPEAAELLEAESERIALHKIDPAGLEGYQAVGNSVLDILVAYTARARQARGDAAGMLAHINQVMAECNAALQKSGASVEFRLADAMEVSWDDTNSAMSYNTALSALTSTSDNQLDQVHARRNEVGADLVSLWVSPPLPGSGSFTVGLAYMMTNNPSFFASYAFSVVHQTYAGGSSLAFPHEIGHNLGLNHDADNGGSNGAFFPDSKGYQQKTLTPKFYTIMAYSSGCSGCTPIDYFSNPGVNYQGVAAGVINQANAVRTIEAVRAAAEAWRPSAPPSCSYGLSPASASVGSGSTSSAVSVTSTSGCNWTAQSNSSWISISSGASGSGNGTVSLSIGSNSAASPRTGTVSVAGQTYTVTQAAAATCNYTLNTTNVAANYNVTNTGVGVTSSPGCAWTATANVSWITITSGSSGTGNGTVLFTVAANPDPATRIGTVTVAGQTVTVTQGPAPSPCNYGLTPSQATLSGGAFNVTINVTAAAGCSWTALPNVPWISVTSGSPGVGNGTLTFLVSANDTASTRTGTMTVAGLLFTVNQAAGSATCTYNLSASSASVGYGAGSANFSVSAGSGCAWTAVSNAGWISVVGGASGSGNGTVTLSIAENTTQSPRTGTVTAGGKTFTVSQAAAPAPCTYNLSASSASVGYGAGSANFSVSAGSGCAWTAVSNAGWISVVGGASGSGNGTVTLSIAENTTQSPRTGTVTAGGKTFTVSQAAAPAPCTYNLSASSVSVGNGSANASVGVVAGTGCAWTATSNAGWISVTGGASGTGNGTVSLAISENSSQSSRTATLTIGGQTFTVLQAAAPAPCSYSLSANSTSINYGSANISINVNAGSGCAWAATSGATWIAVTGGSSGNGNGSVSLFVSENPGQSSRTGSVIIAGQTFTVTQGPAPAPCSYSLTSSSTSVGSAAASATFGVVAGSGCSWSATSNAGWITVTGGVSGVGNGNVSISIAANATQSSRTGTVTVAGQTYTVLQAAAPAPCSYSLSVTSTSVNYDGAIATVVVSAGSGCSWSASSNVNWISASSGASGSGSGSVVIVIAANSSQSARTGTVSIAGQVFTVQQAGAPVVVSCSYTVSPASLTTAVNGASHSVQLSTGGACTWSASANASWITIGSPASGTGSATISFQTQPNPLSSSRTGTLTVAGQTVTVTQAGQAVLPSLTVLPSQVILSAPEGSKNPVETVLAATAGDSPVGLSVGSPTAGWLKVAATSSLTPANLLVSADPKGLSAGTYNATVQVSAAGTANGSVTISVTFQVESAVSLRASPQSLSFRDSFGATVPTTQSLRVRVSGSSMPIRVLTTGESWLSTSAEFAKNTWTVNVSVDPRALSAGVHDAAVRVGCLVVDCEELTIPVRVSIVEPGTGASGDVGKRAKIASGGIVSAASFQQGLSEGAWISVFGEDLANEAVLWTLADFNGDQFPAAIGGVRVKVAGKSAGVQFAGPSQVNFQAPSDLPMGWVEVEIDSPNGTVSGWVYHTTQNPGFFQIAPDGQVAALNVDATAIGRVQGEGGSGFRPAKPGAIISIYGTGFGPTDPKIEPGRIFSGAAELIAKGALKVLIGGVEAHVQFAGLSGAGLNQLNVTVPQLPRGDHEVIAVVDGVPTQFNGKLAIE